MRTGNFRDRVTAAFQFYLFTSQTKPLPYIPGVRVSDTLHQVLKVGLGDLQCLKSEIFAAA